MPSDVRKSINSILGEVQREMRIGKWPRDDYISPDRTLNNYSYSIAGLTGHFIDGID